MEWNSKPLILLCMLLVSPAEVDIQLATITGPAGTAFGSTYFQPIRIQYEARL